MSISPPSDIVLDVARAADPTRYKQAAQKLSELAFARTQGAQSPDAASAFDSALADAGNDPVKKAKLTPRPIIQMPFDADTAMMRLKSDTALSSGMSVSTATAGSAKDSYQGFEAMFLSNFVESILPKDSAGLFGTGSAGQIWRSMLAEKIAGQMAKAGGIGIADQLASAETKAAAPSAGTKSPA